MLGIFYLLGSLFGLTSGAVREGYDKEMGKAAWKKNPTEDGLYWGHGGKQYDIMTGREAFIEVDSRTGHRWVVDAKKSTRIRDVDYCIQLDKNETLRKAGASVVINPWSKKSPVERTWMENAEKGIVAGVRFLDLYDIENPRVYVIREIGGRNYYYDLQTKLLCRTTDGQKIEDVRLNTLCGREKEYKEKDEKVIEYWNNQMLSDPVYRRHLIPGRPGDWKEMDIPLEDYELIRRWK